MPRVEHLEGGAELFGGAALVGLAGVLRAFAPDDARLPLLVPEAVELDRAFVDAGRVHRVALERPGAGLRVEISEKAGFGILARGAGHDPLRDGGGADDVADLLAAEEG